MAVEIQVGSVGQLASRTRGLSTLTTSVPVTGRREARSPVSIVAFSLK